MDFCSGTGHVFNSDFAKDFVVTEAFVVLAKLDLVSGDVRNSFVYCGSELDVKYMGLLALWWLSGWCLVK
jgi:hypothetical protein